VVKEIHRWLGFLCGGSGGHIDDEAGFTPDLEGVSRVVQASWVEDRGKNERRERREREYDHPLTKKSSDGNEPLEREYL
jgi:hypothetical protein